MVDKGEPQHLEKITPENISSILAMGVERLSAQRKKINEENTKLSPDDFFSTMFDRTSRSHAIQCAVNGGEDYRTMREYVVSKTTEEANEKEIIGIFSFLEKAIRQYSLLKQLFLTDIERRIGETKGDSRFWEDAAKKFEGYRQEIKEEVLKFETEYRLFIAENEDMKKIVQELKSGLAEENQESLREIFYEKICGNYSKMVFHSDEAHEEDMHRAAAALEKRS